MTDAYAIVHCVCQGRTALIWAAINGSTAIVGMLIEGGAEIDFKDNYVSSAD